MELFEEQAKDADVLICSTSMPGRKPPILIKDFMVDSMKPGSVIIDIDGNCELTKRHQKYVYKNNVTIIDARDITSLVPISASQLYSTNVCNLLEEMGKAGGFRLDLTVF